VPQLPIEAPLSRFFLTVAFFHAIRNACLKRPPKVGGNSIRKNEERLLDFRTMLGVNNAQNGTVRREQIDFIRALATPLLRDFRPYVNAQMWPLWRSLLRV